MLLSPILRGNFFLILWKKSVDLRKIFQIQLVSNKVIIAVFPAKKCFPFVIRILIFLVIKYKKAEKEEMHYLSLVIPLIIDLYSGINS